MKSFGLAESWPFSFRIPRPNRPWADRHVGWVPAFRIEEGGLMPPSSVVLFAACLVDLFHLQVDIVLRLARERGVQSVVKSKSMATEEIHLNAALEAAGIMVAETDLSEWIIQVAKETPSHIIAPAIHKTTRQVAELFSVAVGELERAAYAWRPCWRERRGKYHNLPTSRARSLLFRGLRWTIRGSTSLRTFCRQNAWGFARGRKRMSP